jgi:hypothetical protein
MMKEKMAMFEEMLERGTISTSEQHDLIQTLDATEKKAVWSDGAEFDPRNLMARQQHSMKESLLEDILRTEKKRIFEELLDQADDSRRSFDPEGYDWTQVENPDTKTVPATLLDCLSNLHTQNGLEALEFLFALKTHEDFRDSPEMINLTRKSVAGWFVGRAFREKRSWSSSIGSQWIEEIFFHAYGFGEIQLTSANTDTIDFEIEVAAFGATQDEAEANQKKVDLWTDVEGSRLWVRSTGLPPSPVLVNLRVTVPHGLNVHLGAERAVIRHYEGKLGLYCNRTEIEDFRGELTIENNPVGYIRAQGIRGSMAVTAVNTPVDIRDWCGDINLKSVLGTMNLSDGSGRVNIDAHHGKVALEGVTTSRLDVSSRTGSITFGGTVMAAGSYALKSIDGEVRVSLSERSDCGMTAESLHGNVEWTLEARGGVWDERTEEGARKYANIRLGSGSFLASSVNSNVYIDAFEADS